MYSMTFYATNICVISLISALTFQWDHQKLNIRCMPMEVIEVCWKLNEAQRRYVEWNCSTLIKASGLESRDLMGHILDRIDPNDMKFRGGPGKTFEITKDGIYHIFGFPNSGAFPRAPEWTLSMKEAARFKEALNLGPQGYNAQGSSNMSSMEVRIL